MFLLVFLSLIDHRHWSLLLITLPAPCSKADNYINTAAPLSLSSPSSFGHGRTSRLPGLTTPALWIIGFPLNTHVRYSFQTVHASKSEHRKICTNTLNYWGSSNTRTHTYTPSLGWWCALVYVPHSLACCRGGCWALRPPGRWRSSGPTFPQRRLPLRTPVPSGWRAGLSCSVLWESSASAPSLCWSTTVGR